MEQYLTDTMLDMDWDSLIKQYSPAMKRRALKYVVNPHDADDIVADCWLSLFTKLPNLRNWDDRVITTYIMTTVQNKAIDFQRNNSHHFIHYSDILLETINRQADDILDCIIYKEIIASILRSLSQKDQRIFQMRIDGHSYADIEATLGICQATLRVRWHRIKLKIKKNGHIENY